ncbi:unnamed protein product [Phytomonas sp. EM1]|nr:unnamed protein product [Phytomonas sp. EM1]|eukprot:CCW61444.1 unnamed protein product [Phytomonas sp. isolate EM1]
MGGNHSKSYWEKDEDALNCNACGDTFALTLRKHHCRNCGYIFCRKCSRGRCSIVTRGMKDPVRVCDSCYRELTGQDNIVRGPSVFSADSETPRVVDDSVTASLWLKNNDDHGNTNASRAADGSAGQLTGDNMCTTSDAQHYAEEQTVEDEVYQQDLYSNYNTFDFHHAPSAQEWPSMSKTMEQLERGSLIRRWAIVRQETHFLDVSMQHAERVEPETLVEYSRETENITLQPEIPLPSLARSLLPYPKAAEEGILLLLEPVKSMHIVLSVSNLLMKDVANSLAQCLTFTYVVDNNIRPVTNAEFSES